MGSCVRTTGVPRGIKILDTVILANEFFHRITIDDEGDGGKPICQSAVGSDNRSASNRSFDRMAGFSVKDMGIVSSIPKENSLRVAACCQGLIMKGDFPIRSQSLAVWQFLLDAYSP